MKHIVCALLVAAGFVLSQQQAFAVVNSMADYRSIPPFINQSVPPLVMLTMSKDHRLFYKAYNDIMDLDGDGTIDTTYKDTINYYGYFDPKKCYIYNTGGGVNRFEPAVAATGTNSHYCTSTTTHWSGNFMNWASMARIDVIRKVLYGGYRITDSATSGAISGVTVLSRTRLPRDGHSFVKVYSGSDLTSLVPSGLMGVATSVSICNTNTAVEGTERSGIMYVVKGAFPFAASTEVTQCTKTLEGAGSVALTDASIAVTGSPFRVEVQVCVTGLLESNCEQYASGSDITYKPTGLITGLGINRQGTTDPSDDLVMMKFALISGSFGAHVGGGVVRSNIVDANNEVVSTTGVVKASSKIIKNINSFRILQYNYGTGSYDVGGAEGSCAVGTNGYTTPYTLVNSSTNCTSWGNPIGEMLYEAIRWFKGLGTPTTQYKEATVDPGALATLTAEATWSDPYGTCPACSKPFVLLFSDTNPSYDSDHLPGALAAWASTISTSDTPSVQTLITNSGINTLEGIGSVLIGENSLGTDRACSSKAGNFTSIRGLCMEEPTKQGAFYTAGLAWHGKTTDLRSDQTGTQKLTTYSVVTNAPIPVLEFPVGSYKAQIVPILQTGCPNTTFANCTSVGLGANNPNGWQSKGQIVDFRYCDLTSYSNDWTNEQAAGYTSCFDILYDNQEYGNDYDLDVSYRLYVRTNFPAAGQVQIKTKAMYANAGTNGSFVGYLINGVTAPGEYYDLRCSGPAGNWGGTISGPTDCDKFNGTDPAENVRVFTVTNTAAQDLKDPLWYAAKYGGFDDANGDNKPDQAAEWDSDANGVPDTYFFAANPLVLESKMVAAFASILNRASSGTAASVLASSTTGEGALYQSYFYPAQFESDGREIKWTGYTQGLFVDMYGNLHEDTNGDGKLICTDDKILITRYDTSSTSTVADLYSSTVGCQATGVAVATDIALNNIKPVWEAGKNLALRSPASTCSLATAAGGTTCRYILTYVDMDGDGKVDSGEFINFETDATNLTKLTPFLNADGAGNYTATNIVNFIRGTQVAGLRDRRLTVGGSLQVWKFGDPVHATPVIVAQPRERYDVLYGDTGYAKFYAKYRARRQVAYVGANDGMLHAFNVGFYHRGDGTHHGCFTMALPDTCATQNAGVLAANPLGGELWAFIPQELLPHLRWLADPAYSHVAYVDLKPKITDARIYASDPAKNCDTCSNPGGWATLLIGGFRFGGSCGTCPTTGSSNGRPMTINADFDNTGSLGAQNRSFYSAYFVLDITDPEQPPVLLWTFSDISLGFTTSYPSIVRVLPSSFTDKTDVTNSGSPNNAKWYVLFGSGATGYGGTSNQRAQLFAVDLISGPFGDVSSPVRHFDADDLDATPGPLTNGFVGDLVTVDRNLDYRVDVAYGGESLEPSPYKGTVFRLTTKCFTGGGACPADPTQWGVASTAANPRMATRVVYKFPCGSASKPCVGPPPASVKDLGPVTSSPAVAVDDANNLWLFLGTGRYYSAGAGVVDSTSTAQQYLIGVKDQLLSNTCTVTGNPAEKEVDSDNCSSVDLIDVSSAEICVLGIGDCGGATKQVVGVSGLAATGSFSDMINLVKTKEGWFYNLPVPGGGAPSERMVATPSVFGGVAFFPTFLPSTDPCVAAGTSNLYGLYYVTGTAYSSPVIGTATSGSNQISKASISLGEGLSTAIAIHIGAQGNGTTGGGSLSGTKACSQSSTGALNCFNVKPALGAASRYISWNHKRD
jgi:type IV pilus assembly protein PilY1